ncbi:MAG: hydroxysqualene dehydroxylase HpnE [Rhodocyclaceae bacterium]
MRIAVIGAGWAGLAAAVELAAARARVTVFEAAREPGGRARSLRREARVLDNGQHILAGACTETLRAMRRVGVDPERALLRIPLSIETPGGLRLRAWRLPAPLNLAAGLAGARGLSLASRIAAARLLATVRRGEPQSGDEPTVAGWLARRGQAGEPARLLWEPLCRAALNTPPQLASARVFARLLRETLCAAREASDLLLPRAPLGELFPAPALRFVLSHGASFHASAPIRAIAPAGGGFRLEGDRHADVYDGIIVATAPRSAARLLAALPGARSALARIEGLAFHPIATIFLQYPPELRLPAVMIAGDGEGADWYFDRGRLEGPAGLVAAVISADAERMTPAGAALAARAHAGLARLLGALPPPSWSFTLVEKRAGFSCTPALARPGNESGVAGLWLAGDYTDSAYPATIESAVSSGGAAARLALARH